MHFNGYALHNWSDPYTWLYLSGEEHMHIASVGLMLPFICLLVALLVSGFFLVCVRRNGYFNVFWILPNPPDDDLVAEIQLEDVPQLRLPVHLADGSPEFYAHLRERRRPDNLEERL